MQRLLIDGTKDSGPLLEPSIGASKTRNAMERSGKEEEGERGGRYLHPQMKLHHGQAVYGQPIYGQPVCPPPPSLIMLTCPLGGLYSASQLLAAILMNFEPYNL